MLAFYSFFCYNNFRRQMEKSPSLVEGARLELV